MSSPRARIAIHGQAAAARADAGVRASTALLAAGYEIIGPDQRADLHVIDLRSGDIAAREARQTAAQLRRASPECGIVYMISPMLGAIERAHLRRSGDLAICGERDLAALVRACRQRLRLRNLAEEAGERLKSLAALTRLSEFPPIETSGAPPSVMIAGSPGALALATIAAASGAAERCDAALSASQAMRGLESGLYDCAVFMPKAAGDPLLGLARTMRRHRRFQDLPVIVIEPEGADAAIEAPSNAEFLYASHLDHDLPARLVLLTRRARLMAAMRKFLTHCAGEGVRDRISGTFTPSFFGQHAERVFARADQTGRVVSLAGARLAATGPDDLDVGGVRLLTEAARLINRVTRAEDCVGRISADTFIVLMSATPRADAEVAARRIEGVIANTMFRARAGKKLFAVAAATAAVERGAGEHVEETLAAILGRLKATTPRTAER